MPTKQHPSLHFNLLGKSGKGGKKCLGNSLAVQWLGLSTFTAWAWVRSLVGELRSHKPHSTAKKKKKTALLPYIDLQPTINSIDV